MTTSEPPKDPQARFLPGIDGGGTCCRAQLVSLEGKVLGNGQAGVNVPAAYEAIAGWQHPYHSMHLTTDMQIACYGSHGNSDGAVIISGTGCSGYSSIGGIQRMHSAFGFPFGDRCGAAWIGLSALRASFLAHDALGPATSLATRLRGSKQW